mmetsp:Transcript_18625/g.33664  ORF Transcript_18625/g.33664 Transcript_18625/m.33664 type:complete len:364 (-) Transcript_18625:41-1132(-)
MRSYAILAVLAVAQGALFARINTGEILAQVQASMRTGGAIDDIYGYLDQLESQIRSEQAEHDTLLYKQTEDCDTEGSFRTQEVSDAKFAIERASNELDQCDAALNHSENLLEENLVEQTETKDILEKVHAARAAEKALYDKRTQDHTDLIEAIDECLELMYQLREEDTSSLLQVSNSMAKLLVKGSRLNKTAMIAPIVTMFAQMKEVDQASVERVIDLFNELRDNTVASQTDYDVSEAASIEAYTQQVNELNERLAELESDEQSLRQHIRDMNQCVANQTAVLSEATAKESRNSELLESSTALCNDFYNEYETESLNRSQELKLIQEVRALVQRRLNQLKPEAYARANADSYEEYENKYPTSS